MSIHDIRDISSKLSKIEFNKIKRHSWCTRSDLPSVQEVKPGTYDDFTMTLLELISRRDGKTIIVKGGDPAKALLLFSLRIYPHNSSHRHHYLCDPSRVRYIKRLYKAMISHDDITSLIFNSPYANTGGSHLILSEIEGKITRTYGIGCVIISPPDNLIDRTISVDGTVVFSDKYNPIITREPPKYDAVVAFTSKAKALKYSADLNLPFDPLPPRAFTISQLCNAPVKVVLFSYSSAYLIGKVDSLVLSSDRVLKDSSKLKQILHLLEHNRNLIIHI